MSIKKLARRVPQSRNGNQGATGIKSGSPFHFRPSSAHEPTPLACLLDDGRNSQ
jgi:hypothetical protein